MSAPVDTEKFATLVRRIHPAYRLLRAWELKGGISAQVTALEVEQSDGTVRKMIVRQHGAMDLKNNPQIAADEYKLLQILQAAGLPAPAPVYVESSGEIFPAPCLVVDYIEGATDFTPANLADKIGQMVLTLAQIHQVNSSRYDLSFLPKQSDRYARKLRDVHAVIDGSLDEGRIRGTLSVLAPVPQWNAPVLLHGDYWPGNLLWQNGRLTGVIDWEDAAEGDALADVANTRLEILWAFGSEAMHLFTKQYQMLMPRVDFANLAFLDLYAALRPAGKIGEWAGNAETEQVMRDRHKWFVAQAFEKLV